MKKSTKILLAAFFTFTLTMLASCENGRSYADLLNDESKSVNRFLVTQHVIGAVPADSIFETGKSAPYYQLDNEGNIYMQVITLGDGPKVEDGQRVYFRFLRYNLTYYKNTEDWWTSAGEGNLNDLSQANTYFLFNNYQLPSSSSWGSGIQMPLNYLPYGSEVNIVIKSQYGITSETSNVTPYLYHIRYYQGVM